MDDPSEDSVVGALVRINKCHQATPVNSRRLKRYFGLGIWSSGFALAVKG